MLTTTESALLKELLEIAPLPEGTLSYNELMGFMFGLAITPVYIDRDEWLDAIFGEDPCSRCGSKSNRPLSASLTQIYSLFLAKHEQNQLNFPYPLETLRETDTSEVKEWVSGLEEAFSLRPDIWDPEVEENFTNFSDIEREELFFCMMVIQGLADPVEVQLFLERIPDELFHELFSIYDFPDSGKERNVQALLLGALPLAVQALQSFSLKLRMIIPEHVQPTSSSVLKYESLESMVKGSNELGVSQADSKNSNVIQVDFNKRVITGKISHTEQIRHQLVPCYQLKISIKDAKPPIWRRVVVPGSITLAQLHLIIQISMGWQNAHLHQFRINDDDYGPDDGSSFNEHILDERSHSLHEAAEDVYRSFEYIYDFGDYWQHQILIEKRFAPEEADALEPVPRILKGRRACPPEDIGGIWGYQEFLEAYKDPSHDDHATMVQWAGPDFRPELFGAEEIEQLNQILSSIHIG